MAGPGDDDDEEAQAIEFGESGDDDDDSRHLNQHLDLAKGSPAFLLAAVLAARHETARPPSEASSQRRTIEGRRSAVATIIANLLTANGNVPNPWFALDLRKDGRDPFDRQGFRARLKDVMPALLAEGLIERRDPVIKQRRTCIRATLSCLAMLSRRGCSAADVRVSSATTPLVILVRPKSGFVLYPESLASQEPLASILREVTAINTHLRSFTVTLAGVSRSDAFLHRRFTLLPGDWDEPSSPPLLRHHGRLYGGWWQNLPSRDRHLIKIDGEEICDLDFSASIPRLAYLSPPVASPFHGDADPYAIPGFENHRKAAKQVLLAILSSKRRDKRSLQPESAAELLPLLPPGIVTIAAAFDAVRAHHRPLAPLFGTAPIHALMFAESRILLAALSRLARERIPALPMHDGLMVRRSHLNRATAIMTAAATSITGTALPVAEKPITPPA